jgi:hypothetical protein
MDEELIQAQAMAARIVCLRMTAQHLKTLHDSVDQASRLPARSQWDRKAAAHAEIFSLLAAAADPVRSEALHVAADLVHDLMLAVGPAAGGMIASSRRRLLAHMAAGRADEAALEMEKHLRGLHYMSRLARRPLGRVTARLPWPVSAGEGLGFDDDGGEHEDQHGRCHPCRPRTQSMGAEGSHACADAETGHYRRYPCRLPPRRHIVISSPEVSLRHESAQVARCERGAVIDALQRPERRDLQR